MPLEGDQALHPELQVKQRRPGAGDRTKGDTEPQNPAWGLGRLRVREAGGWRPGQSGRLGAAPRASLERWGQHGRPRGRLTQAQEARKVAGRTLLF